MAVLVEADVRGTAGMSHHIASWFQVQHAVKQQAQPGDKTLGNAFPCCLLLQALYAQHFPPHELMLGCMHPPNLQQFGFITCCCGCHGELRKRLSFANASNIG